MNMKTKSPEPPSNRRKPPSIMPGPGQKSLKAQALEVLEQYLIDPESVGPSDVTNSLEILKTITDKDDQCVRMLARVIADAPSDEIRTHARDLLCSHYLDV